ncbi:MAG: hypothetical protein NXH83_13750 [Rhodobacteraceae bacterium]|nr:hypothetical protein [Paracoccaceae bacterium]
MKMTFAASRVKQFTTVLGHVLSGFVSLAERPTRATFMAALILVAICLVASSADAQNIGYGSVYTEDGQCCASGELVDGFPGAETSTFGEFDLSAIGLQMRYFLSISPTSVLLGRGVSNSVDVFYYQGDGSFPGSTSGSFWGSVPISQPAGVASGWYEPDGYGGYFGDSFIDVTVLVETARLSSWSFLGFEIRANDTNAVLIRDLRLTNYSNSSGVTPIPEIDSVGASGVFFIVLALSCFIRFRSYSSTVES